MCSTKNESGGKLPWVPISRLMVFGVPDGWGLSFLVVGMYRGVTVGQPYIYELAMKNILEPFRFWPIQLWNIMLKESLCFYIYFLVSHRNC